MPITEPLRLVEASAVPPTGVEELLTVLGAGDERFAGTSFGRGESTLADFLRSCIEGQDRTRIAPGLVPQTVYWMIAGDDRRAVGVVRVRHHLNERLLQSGGHIGYYVHPAHRGRRYATVALRLALDHLRERGEPRALLTAHPDNALSIRAILANGGVPDGQGAAPDTGVTVNRYWIDLGRTAICNAIKPGSG